MLSHPRILLITIHFTNYIQASAFQGQIEVATYVPEICEQLG